MDAGSIGSLVSVHPDEHARLSCSPLCPSHSREQPTKGNGAPDGAPLRAMDLAENSNRGALHLAEQQERNHQRVQGQRFDECQSG